MVHLRAQTPVTFEYFYDSLNQLTRVIDSGGNVLTYTYDQVGNILAVGRTTVGELDPPSIAHVSPDQVNQAEVATLHFEGTGLLGSAVTTTHPGITVDSAHGNDTKITANVTIAGSAPTGPAQMTLTTVAGSDSITITVLAAAPEITGILPNKGPSTGDTPVTISGAHLTPDTTVAIGANPATDVAFVDFETLTVTTPVGPEQQPPVAVDVTVTNPNGSDTLTDGYTYAFGLTYGRTVSAAISSLGEIHEYAFNGNAGDVVRVRMSDGSVSPTSIDSRIELFDPAGVSLGSVAAEVEAVLDVTLPTAGTYLILTSDAGGEQAASYGIHLQRLNNPGAVTPIAFGETIAASIGALAEADAYSFTAAAGDVVRVRMSDGSVSPTSIDSRIELFDPAGVSLGSVAAEVETVLEVMLPAAGTYAILTSDAAADQTASYNLTLQRTNNPANQVAIAYGNTLSAAVATNVELDVFAFSGTTADEILLEMQPTSGIEGNLRVYRPDGTLLCSGSNGSGNSGLLAVPCTLDATGTHYIFAADTAADETGTYDLTLTLQNP